MAAAPHREDVLSDPAHPGATSPLPALFAAVCGSRTRIIADRAAESLSVTAHVSLGPGLEMGAEPFRSASSSSMRRHAAGQVMAPTIGIAAQVPVRVLGHTPCNLSLATFSACVASLASSLDWTRLPLEAVPS